MRYLVHVERKTSYTVEVEADGRTAAWRTAASAPIPSGVEPVIEVETFRQLGEPWVYGWSGDSPENFYLGRPDGYLSTDALLVFTRALGNRFTQEDVQLLLNRVASVVGEVDGHWNGAGTSGLSIQLKKPFGKLTAEQVATIMAPRGDVE